MNNKIVIALDCMGGDNAPGCVIEGLTVLDKTLKEELFFLLYGDENKINRYLNSQIPDFEENLSHYERHLLLYKEYKKKYEKIKSITDGRSR